MKQLSQQARNLTSAGVIMIVSGYWYFAAESFRPLSRLFPQVLAVIVFSLALILAVLTVLGKGPKIRLSEGDDKDRHSRAATLITVLAVWTALIPVAGLLIASVVGTLLMGLLTFRAHAGTLRAVLIALMSVALFYLLFNVLLNVPFPMGLLG
ncbi:MAG: tripartite tricarboxylate transporter TctB family protein [Alkalispirochaetaceae bacterium]